MLALKTRYITGARHRDDRQPTRVCSLRAQPVGVSHGAQSWPIHESTSRSDVLASAPRDRQEAAWMMAEHFPRFALIASADATWARFHGGRVLHS